MVQLRAQLEARIHAEREPIAVVGIGCRFPGVDGPIEFADFLQRGDTAVGPVSSARISDMAGPRDERYKVGGFFDSIAEFDAEAFGMDAEEAIATDPHLRLLLEVTRDAMEDAALAGGQLIGSRTSVHLALGAQNNDFSAALMDGPTSLARHAIAGSFHSLMPGRVSYHFDLRGPSYVIDAACASSLVAVDLACQALRRNECDNAVVAAVNLVLSDVVSKAIDNHGLWSATGGSRSFDEDADGFVRGEGAGTLVLRRLSDAQRDGDPIHAVILAASSGQDGHGNGVAAPNAPAQGTIMRRAIEQAAIEPGQIGYVEAHATGTRLGDAIEVEAINHVYGDVAGRAQPVVIGALKPQLGHLEAASGMAALIKVILARAANGIPRHEKPGTLNVEIAEFSEQITLETPPGEWSEAAPYAAVTALGMSGTNAHIIVGPAPVGDAEALQDGPFQLRLAAPNETSLRNTAKRLLANLDEQTNVGAFCHTLRAGRISGPAICTAVVSTQEDVRECLRSVAGGEPLPSDMLTEAEKQCSENTRLHLAPTAFSRRRHWPDFKLEHIPRANTIVADMDDLFFQQEWVTLPVEGSTGALPNRIFLIGDGPFSEKIAQQLQKSGCDVVVVLPDELPSDSDCQILYPAGRSFKELTRLQQLLPALIDRQVVPRLAILAEGAREGNALAMAALALGRTIAVEHPELHVHMIDLQQGFSDAGDRIIDALRIADNDPFVRVTAQGLEVPRLQKSSHKYVPYNPDPQASYLVTGGFGGIGRAVAQRLVERGVKHLVLVGRNTRPLAEVTDYETRGVKVITVAADVADRDAMAAIFEQSESDGRPIKGVFHTAGAVSNALLVRQAAVEFSTPFRSKLLGASVLDSITRNRQIDTFVLFSSITAYVPLTGAGAYGAANASLGAIARARHAAGHPATCIYWGTWDGSGMLESADETLARRWAAHGIDTITQDRAFCAMEALMAAGVTEQVAAHCDWNKISRHAIQDASGAALYSQLLGTNIEISIPDRPQTAKVDEVVSDAVSRLLGIDRMDPRLMSSFGDLGMSSLVAVQLRNDLSVRLGIRLPVTLAFNYPSVLAVTNAINRRMEVQKESRSE